ncbi:hypothetical protein [Peribacillus simplex]|uniref:hypothetical protein n=1 Tax=Peribacillus simplex TaxID=1478 RepID=UPI0021A5D6E4|nr:hypothetical protein [Peribacillus simplex]WHY59335.1 hypothetical protein QNH43_10880 [Peribacillus simplex]
MKTSIPILSGKKIVANDVCLTLLGSNSDIVIILACLSTGGRISSKRFILR